MNFGCTNGFNPNTLLQGLIFAGINFRGSCLRGTFFRDFAEYCKNKFRENAQNRGSRENYFREIVRF